MSSAEAQQRIAELRAKVAYHEELYRKKAQPEISDFDFDQLSDELARLEKEFPQFASVDSPARWTAWSKRCFQPFCSLGARNEGVPNPGCARIEYDVNCGAPISGSV